MKFLFIFFGVIYCCIGAVTSEEIANLNQSQPIFPFKSAVYMNVAADLQTMPKERAIEHLKSWSQSGCLDMEIIILCRMLFEAKKEEIFRNPRIGGSLVCGFSGSGEMQKLALSRFKLIPICIVDGVPFLIVQANFGSGPPTETGVEYLSYCLESMQWNAFQYKKADRETLEASYKKLLQTYYHDRTLNSWEISFLRSQLSVDASK
jgi:hypothetical protein